MSTLQDEVRNFFITAGIDFQTNLVAAIPGAPLVQKSIFFNDRTGVLFVRATLRDLDIIEQAIQALNIAPPQVTIEAKFVEFSQSDNKALGFDWFLGNTLINGGAIAAQGGSAPSMSGRATAANRAGVFPATAGFPTQFPNTANDQRLTTGLRNTISTGGGSIPELSTITGILTDPQFRLVIRALEQRDGVDILQAPKVTTVSGRQARVSVQDTRTIVIGINVGNQGAGGFGGGGVGGFGAGPGAAVGGGFQ
ncbi:MAG: hypothetical protein HY674_09275 [Chloroflexi bacterium]|nr:hypothetical protein [Chloroflexota bacterium]